MAKTYEPIQTTTLGSAAASYTFSSIPATYTDLVVIIAAKTGVAQSHTIQFNSDTTSNYSDTYLYGDGSNAASARDSTQTAIRAVGRIGTAISTTIINVFNYTNTTTFKTVLARGADAGSLAIATVGLWRKTPEAINSMTIAIGTGTYDTGSTFTLYGIKAA